MDIGWVSMHDEAGGEMDSGWVSMHEAGRYVAAIS